MPGPPLAVFWITNLASFSFVKVQVMSAPGSTNDPGTEMTLPASVPKVPELPVLAALASAQVASVRRHPAGIVSAIATPLPRVVTANGADAVGVPMTVVVIAVEALARLVMAKLKLPTPPMVVLATRTCAGRGVFVNVQEILSLAWAVSVKLVPGPAGSTVDDAANALLHEIELTY